MTTKNLLTSLLVLLAVAVVSCQKEPSTSGLHEDYLVYTDYDQQADFSDVETFYLPDSILVPCCGVRRKPAGGPSSEI